MSASGGGREVAHRIFATEFENATLSHSESDEERAPNYVISPTGARMNRVFVVGTLTEVTQVSEEMVRARVSDPTGAFVLYAGQYEPDQLARLERLEPPLFVAVTGKARTFEPDDGDRIYSSLRPESVAVVDAATRDRWVVDAAEFTHDRIEAYALAAQAAAEGRDVAATLERAAIPPGRIRGIELALEHYETTPDYLANLRSLATDAVRVIADDIDQVNGVDLRPDERGTDEVTFEDLTGEAAAVLEDAPPAPSTDGDGATDAPPVEHTGAETPDTSGETSESEQTDQGTVSPDPDPGSDTEQETSAAETDQPADDTIEDPDVDLYEMDDEERAALEAEFDTGFTPGTEVDTTEGDPDESASLGEQATTDPVGAEGEQTPTEESTSPSEQATTEPAPGVGAEGEQSPAEESTSPGEPASGATPDPVEADDEQSTTAPDTDQAEEPTDDADADVTDLVVDAMGRLDDGDGADREAVIEDVAAASGADREIVESAIQDALMDGRCYEPDEGQLKAI